MRDWQRATMRHAARHRHHVLFGDTALDESLRVCRRKLEQAAVLDQIRVERDQLRTPRGLIDERFAIGGDEVIRVARLTARTARTTLGVQFAEAKGSKHA